jgi:hypothetical protein
MASELEELLRAAKGKSLTLGEKEEQRRSFAYGNTKIENPRITRETVDQEAESLKDKKE